MPYFTHPLVDAGAVIELAVGVIDPRAEVLRRSGFAVPERQLVRAVVDPGSAVTGLAPHVLQALDSTPVGELPVLTPSTGLTPHVSRQYLVSLTLRHVSGERHFPSVAVIETVFTPEENIQAMLGRDLLSHCLFVYDGQANRFALAF
jgi:hypothetical protein